MYKKFFGFKERPFKLVPNPAYLFLSRSHEEALAHLAYAISQGDGFVEITGEVGTGKTTLCRAFLESLDEKTEAAYIFNPKLDAVQLLRAINDEFDISSDHDDAKGLIDILNTFLIEKKAEGRKVILIVDEAQNLSIEVLEQLRLLSNLETTTSKLLQIILVGQPELGEMLDSNSLRQLGQRITLSCHLNPLTRKETREYIRHRIQIASKRPGIQFTRAAFRTIFRYSGGIPRLINIVCDRMLLTAFGLNQRKITGSIAGASIKELAGRGDLKRFNLQGNRRATLVFVLLVLVFFLIVLYRPQDLNMNGIFTASEQKSEEALKPAPVQIAIRDEGGPVKTQEVSTEGGEPKSEQPEEAQDIGQRDALEKPTPEEKPLEELAVFLTGMDPRTSRHAAIKAAIDLWQGESEINPYLDNVEDDPTFFRFAAKQNGLLIYNVKKDFDLIEKFNLPAILEFYPPGGLSPRYLTLSRLQDEKISFKTAAEDKALIHVDPMEVKSLWTGVAYVPWKNFLDYEGTIPKRAPRESIITLKMLIHDIGFEDVEINPFYDEPAKDAVKEIQGKYGIKVDGVVGPMTKIVLYNEKESLKIPHIKDKLSKTPSEAPKP